MFNPCISDMLLYYAEMFCWVFGVFGLGLKLLNLYIPEVTHLMQYKTFGALNYWAVFSLIQRLMKVSNWCVILRSTGGHWRPAVNEVIGATSADPINTSSSANVDHILRGKSKLYIMRLFDGLEENLHAMADYCYPILLVWYDLIW